MNSGKPFKNYESDSCNSPSYGTDGWSERPLHCRPSKASEQHCTSNSHRNESFTRHDRWNWDGRKYHDIGKISVPAEILSKPGSLTDIQFALIKAHPQTGYEILKGSNSHATLPGLCSTSWEDRRVRISAGPLRRRYSSGSEDTGSCWCGGTMSSHRPYRPALGIEKAVEEISSNKGNATILVSWRLLRKP